MERLSKTFAGRLLAEEIICEEDREIYEFGFLCLLDKLLVWAVLLIIGTLAQTLPPIIAFTALFSGTKSRVGGWHAKTVWGCRATTVLLCVFGTMFCMRLPPWFAGLFSISSLVLTRCAGTTSSPNNPKTEEEEAQMHRKAYAFLAAAGMILSFVSIVGGMAGIIALCAAGGMQVAVITLLPGKGEEKHEQSVETVGKSKWSRCREK